MPTYHHKFKCRKCGYFIVETQQAAPPPESQHTYFKYEKIVQDHMPIWGNTAPPRRPIQDCMIQVKYIETISVLPATVDLKQRALTKVKDIGKRYRDTKAKRPLDNAPSMVAVMYDAVLERWFEGKTGTTPNKGDIPMTIWNRIPEKIDPDKYAFGRTCAEVLCLRQAYENRSTADRGRELEGSLFAAYSPIDGKVRPPCGACDSWITGSGGIAVK